MIKFFFGEFSVGDLNCSQDLIYCVWQARFGQSVLWRRNKGLGTPCDDAPEDSLRRGVVDTRT